MSEPDCDVRELLRQLRVNRERLVNEQEGLRSLLAKNVSLIREIDATISEGEEMLSDAT